MGVRERQTIYTASLEAHIDHLHEQLAALDKLPIDPQELAMFEGLNNRAAKV